MSRIAKMPVKLVTDVTADINDNSIIVKGAKSSLELTLHKYVSVKLENNELIIFPKEESKAAWAMAGTTRSLINNMVIGVTAGFKKELKLVGVGYRAAIQGDKINLTLGFSHPIEFNIPEGINVDAPSQTDLVITGADKQLVGEVAAKVRAFRPPEPYKGKGVRYSDERIVLKEAKKK